jgi:hypothetical protein
MFTVYRIDTYSVGNNKHSIDRGESWIERKDKEFLTEMEAKQYIRERSLIHTELVNFLIKGFKMMEGEEKERTINAFCFDDPRYLKYRRFFIGRAPKKEILQALRNDGVTIKKGIQ